MSHIQGVPKVPRQSQNCRVFYLEILHLEYPVIYISMTIDFLSVIMSKKKNCGYHQHYDIF